MILLDVYALVALLADEPAATEVEDLLRGGGCGAVLVNLAEAIDVSCRVHGLDEDDVRAALEPLLASAALASVSPTEPMAWRAAALRVRHYTRRATPVSLADCFLISAAEDGDEIATADTPLATIARAEGVAIVGLPDSSGRRP